jgi:hypothetical protein
MPVAVAVPSTQHGDRVLELLDALAGPGKLGGERLLLDAQSVLVREDALGKGHEVSLMLSLEASDVNRLPQEL